MNDIGHNRPNASAIAEETTAALSADYPNLPADVEAITDRADQLPEAVDDDNHDMFAAVVTDARGLAKRIEAYRVSEKEPHLVRGKATDGFFNPLKTAADNAVTRANRAITVYLQQKERERREAARLEAARLEREAQEKRKAEEKARQIAEDKRRREDARAEADRAADDAAWEAQQSREQAAEAMAEALAPAADLARTRTEHGTSTLRTVWTYEVMNMDAIPLETLRQFISPQDIEKAVGRFVKAGHRTLPGVRIYQQTSAAVR